MCRFTSPIYFVLATFPIAISAAAYSTEIAKFDDGPFAGMGYPYSESARVGNLLFLAGQIGEDGDGKLVPDQSARLARNDRYYREQPFDNCHLADVDTRP